jgi:ubiquinone/menaquinone biosynthesis C-methylase UbiE
MSKFNDPQYLKSDQYRDSSNLDARVVIHQRFSTNSYGWFQWVFDPLFKLPENAKILELGCGHGLLWRENISRIPMAWSITLSDLSPGMLDAAWRNLVVTGRAFQFKEIDAQSIPFQDETFDAVIANHMLQHVPDRPKAIAEIKRVLRPHGKLIATTIGKNHMLQLNDWLARGSGGRLSGMYSLLFTLESGADQLKECFAHVSLSRYQDNLEVTDVEPIIAYIRSGITASDLREDELARLQSDLEKELREKGKIFIAKDSGLFEAIK